MDEAVRCSREPDAKETWSAGCNSNESVLQVFAVAKVRSFRPKSECEKACGKYVQKLHIAIAR